MVLGLIMAITLLSLGFLSRSQTEMACGQNMALRMQMDQGAVSALEHNSPAGLKIVAAELMRTLKPGRPLLATLTAARDQDWWHEESSGWCYTADSLRDIFELPPETPSNYAEYDQLFNALRDCAELRDNLASFYFNSKNNGMPLGIWDPKYQPVGICKIKQA